MTARQTVTSLLAALCLPALSATSPIASTNDYVFTRVTAMGTNVAGVVMGDGGDYGAMRFEDLAFLHEAAAERLAFTGDVFDFETNVPCVVEAWEFGRWSADDTNGTIRSVQAVTSPGATNTIARLRPVTNMVPRGVSVDPAGGRMIRCRTLPTTSLAGLFAADSMYISSPVLVPEGSNSIDYVCQDGHMDYVEISTNGLNGLFRASAITNAYGELRACMRPVVYMPFVGRLDALDREEFEYSDYTTEMDDDGHVSWVGPSSDAWASPVTNGEFAIRVEGVYSRARRKYGYYRYDNPDAYPDLIILPAVQESSKSYRVQVPLMSQLLVRAPFKANVDTAGGKPSRIADADVAIECVVSASVESWTGGGAAAVEAAVTNRTVLIPVSSALSGQDEGGYATFELLTSWSAVRSACESAIGVSIPDAMSAMSCPEPPSIPDGEMSSSSTRSYSLSIRPAGAVGVLVLNPFTKLQGW